MAGNKVEGWFLFTGVLEDLSEKLTDHMAGQLPDSRLLFSIGHGVEQLAHATRDATQELYERIQRLHQKIDRIEKKLGTV